MIKTSTILLVDDEVRILNFLKAKLKASGYKVITALNGLEALEQVQNSQPDLVILDILMPKMDGLEALKQLRTFSNIPVIVLTAKGEDVDKIKGLSLGADDYMAKPFNPDELLARIKAVLRRFEPSQISKALKFLSLADITMDFEKHTVTVRGKETYLTKTEWMLLGKLAQNAGRLMTYEELLTQIWGPEYRNDIQFLRTWISRLRNKLEADPRNPKLIRTITKTGYIIDSPLS